MELSRQFKINKPKLVACLRGNSNIILQHAHAKEILADGEYQALRDNTDHDKVNETIIDKVCFKGEETCAKFLHMLKEEADIKETIPQLGNVLNSLQGTPGENASHASGGGSVNVTGGTSGACASEDASAKIPDKILFFKKNLSSLNEKVTKIPNILDRLVEEGFGEEQAAQVKAQQTSHAQMRMIITNTKTKKLAGHLFDALVKYEEDLMEELVDEYLNKKK